MKTINENGTFRKRSPEWNDLKTLFSRVRVDRRKRNFSKTLRTRYQFQATPRKIRNLFKMADERFPFLSSILGFISNLTACFQANLADYSRRRQNIIRLLSLPVSRGGRLDLPLVWLCFCPDSVSATLKNVTTIQTHTKEIQRWRQFIITCMRQACVVR